jgi:hypothetical protein
MSEWIIKRDTELPCEDMVLYRGVEKLLNLFRRKEMGYSQVIDNIADYLCQKDKEIREEERKKLIQEIKELPIEAEGIKYEDVQWVRFLIISKLKENASQE